MSRHLLEGGAVVGRPAFLAALVATELDAPLQNSVAALKPAFIFGAGGRIRDELANQRKTFITVAQVKQASDGRFLELFALAFSSITVHYTQIVQKVLLSLFGGKVA